MSSLAASVNTHRGSTATSAAPSHGTASQLVVNELLVFFLTNKYDCHPRSSLQSELSDFYQEEVVLAIKNVLTQYVDGTHQHNRSQKRVGENKRDRSVDDILNIFG